LFVRGLKPTANGNTGFTPDGNSLPMWFFDLVNQDTPDKQLLATANATFDRTFRAGIGPATPVGVLSKWAIAGTALGRVDATRFLVPNQIRALTAERQTAYLGGRPLANRLTLREGPQALDAQRLGAPRKRCNLRSCRARRACRAANRSCGSFPHGLTNGMHSSRCARAAALS
jgi:hypothetical protein